MKIKKIFILIIALLFFFSSFAQGNNNNNTKIIVKIENELITSYDIKSKILGTLILAKKEINQTNINSLKKNSLEYLIQNRLKKIELKKYNFDSETTQINSYLNSITSNNIESLKEIFSKNGIDFQAYKDELDVEFKWRKLIYNLYAKKIEIDQNEIDKEIKIKVQNQNELIKYNLSEIEVLSKNNDQDNKIILQIKDEINNFGFENAVIKFSISSTATNKGNLGWINAASLSKEFLKILDKMQIGDISNPIKKQNKIILLKLNDKKISNYSDINKETLKKELINQKKNELFNLYSSSFISKLRNTKFIEYYK